MRPKFPRLPENNARQGFFERADFEAVVKLLPEDLQDFTRFGFLTGWRSGEIKSLAWSEIRPGDKAAETTRREFEERRASQADTHR
jgi:integrase